MFGKLFAALLLCAAAALPAQATSVLPLYLEEIVDTAAVAFQGTVTEVRSERDADGRVVTYTTFRVNDKLKGEAGITHTIKQIGGETADGFAYRVLGIPKFSVGQDVVVFLYGVSSKGFSSPVGLDQGRFHVGVDESGEHVSNGRDFRDMAQNLVDVDSLDAQAKAKGGPVRKMGLAEFKQLVRARARARDTASGVEQ